MSATAWTTCLGEWMRWRHRSCWGSADCTPREMRLTPLRRRRAHGAPVHAVWVALHGDLRLAADGKQPLNQGENLPQAFFPIVGGGAARQSRRYPPPSPSSGGQRSAGGSAAPAGSGPSAPPDRPGSRSHSSRICSCRRECGYRCQRCWPQRSLQSCVNPHLLYASLAQMARKDYREIFWVAISS